MRFGLRLFILQLPKAIVESGWLESSSIEPFLAPKSENEGDD